MRGCLATLEGQVTRGSLLSCDSGDGHGTMIATRGCVGLALPCRKLRLREVEEAPKSPQLGVGCSRAKVTLCSTKGKT